MARLGAVLLLLVLLAASGAKIIRGPENRTVAENGNAAFYCEIQDLTVKQVYWTLDKPFKMLIWTECYDVLNLTGRSNGSPHCDPEVLVTVTRNGNLSRWRVELLNVTMKLDGQKVSCSPMGEYADATLSVMVAPKTVMMDRHPNGSRIEFNEGENQRALSCYAPSAKMASNFSIDWYVNGAYQSTGVTRVNNSMGQLNNYVSEFNLTRRMLPSSGADAFVECRVDPRRNSYVTTMRLWRVTVVQIRSPSQPTVNWGKERTYQVNETFSWTCETQGGWPEPSVFWYRDYQPVDPMYETSRNGDPITRNTLTLRLREEDNQAEYRCEVSNSLYDTKKKKISRLLNVSYNARILGFWRTAGSGSIEAMGDESELVSVGDPVTVRCMALGNPAATISFLMGGSEVPADSSTVRLNYDASTRAMDQSSLTRMRGHETVAMKTFVVNSVSGRSVTFGCLARNGGGREVARQMLPAVHVAHAPSRTYIEGKESRVADEDQRLYLRCVALDAYPSANFSWKIMYANGTEQQLQRGAAATLSSNGQDTSELRDLLVKRDMVMARIVCDVSHRALRGRMLSQSVTLAVRYGVTSVNVVPLQNPLVENLTAQATCSTDWSLPKATLRWHLGSLNDSLKHKSISLHHVGNDSFGYRTIETIQYYPTDAEDGKTIYCTAQTFRDGELKSHAYQQVVHYAPRVERVTDQKVNEGETLTLSPSVRANPPASYMWLKNGDPLENPLSSVGPRLQLINVRRSDTGMYELIANNSVGLDFTRFFVRVRYIDPPTLQLSDDRRSLSCQYNANPPPAVTIVRVVEPDAVHEWQPSAVTTGSLSVTPPIRGSVGAHVCIVRNAVNQLISSPVHFTPPRKVTLERSAPITKAALQADSSSASASATLRCIADSPTKPNFTWSRNGQTVEPDASKSVSTMTIEDEKFESLLQITHANANHLGPYVCAAKNDFGIDSLVVDLVSPRAPDEPLNLTTVDASHSTITLSWLTGFNGGADQKFVVRYRETGAANANANAFRYIYYTPSSQFKTVQSCVVSGLASNTEYELFVKAQSKLGETPFIEPVYRRTGPPPPPLTVLTPVDPVAATNTPLMIVTGICVAAMILLVLNVLLICLCVRNKRRKRQAPKKYPLSGMEMLNAASPIYDPASAAAPLLNVNGPFAPSPLHAVQLDGTANDLFTSIENVTAASTGLTASPPPPQLYVPDLDDPQVVQVVERLPCNTLKTYSKLDNTLDGFNDDLYKVYQKVIFQEAASAARNSSAAGSHKTINVERNFNRQTADVLNNLDVINQHQLAAAAQQQQQHQSRANLDTFQPQSQPADDSQQAVMLPWLYVSSARHSTADILDHRGTEQAIPAAMTTSASAQQINASFPLPIALRSAGAKLPACPTGTVKKNGYRPSLATVASDQETPFGTDLLDLADMRFISGAPRASSPDLPSPADDYEYDSHATQMHTLPSKRQSRKVKISEGHLV